MGRLVTGGVCTYEQREGKESYKLMESNFHSQKGGPSGVREGGGMRLGYDWDYGVLSVIHSYCSDKFNSLICWQFFLQQSKLKHSKSIIMMITYNERWLPLIHRFLL